MRHRLNPFRSLVKMFVDRNREDLATEYAHRGIDKSLLEYHERRRQGIQLGREEQEKSNFNFIDGFYVETE